MKFQKLTIPSPTPGRAAPHRGTIEALAGRVNEAQRPRREAENELGALIDSVLQNLMQRRSLIGFLVLFLNLLKLILLEKGESI